jgi:ABC-2 type transport system permease protein
VSWSVVARKDFDDSVRSRWLQALTVLFVVLVALAVLLERFIGSGATVTSERLVNGLVMRDLIVTGLVPLIALVVSYNAVVGERESGSLKLLLSLPHTRGEVVVGKLIGRAASFGLAVVVGMLVPALALALGPLRLQIAGFVGFLLFTVVLGIVFVSIAVGTSAAVATNIRAITIATAIYFLFVPVWSIVQLPLRFFLTTSGVPGWLPLTGAETFRLLRLINPTELFKILTGAYLDATLYAGDQAALHASATAMLVVWLLAPILVGFVRFERADL